jgi:cyclophilin family peptidyl-prolyl cis-trans isomerase/HEAT repeat protein
VLHDASPAVRAEAAFALGQLGDSSATVISSLAALGSDAAQDPTARAEAMAALGKLRTEASRVAILALLAPTGTEATPPAVLNEALLAIWRFPRQPGIAPRVAEYARAQDAEQRWRAVYALMRLGDPSTIPVLLHRLEHDQDPLVRALAARGLRAAVADSAALRAEAVERLTAATGDPHPHVRINALRALGGYRTRELATTLGRGLQDADANVQVAAAEALGDLGGELAAPLLEATIHATDARLALRGAVLTALLRVAPDRALPLAEEMGQRTEWLARLYTARALSAAPKQSAIPSLRRLVADPDPRVAAAALESLAALKPDPADGLHRLIVEQLGAADPGVRTGALHALAPRVTAADLPVLLDAYDRARQDTVMNDAARAAVAALGELAKRGVPVQRSFFLRFPPSPDPIIRVDVGQHLGTAGWRMPFPIETGRDLVFYEDVVRQLVLPELAHGTRPRALIHTAGGTITIELAAAEAPLTVHNFLTLADQGYFTRFRWHRVVPNFVLQDGDPRGDGEGGPGYAIRDELNRLRYLRGTVGMALAGPDTGGSQFFIAHAPQPHLDGGYTVFGKVVSGMEIADRIAQDDPILRIEREGAPAMGEVGRGF